LERQGRGGETSRLMRPVTGEGQLMQGGDIGTGVNRKKKDCPCSLVFVRKTNGGREKKKRR